MDDDRLLREREVRQVTGLSRQTRWRLERAGKFPRRRQISDGAIAWLSSEIQQWVAACGVKGREAA
jgi:prophage regulatory protein